MLQIWVAAGLLWCAPWVMASKTIEIGALVSGQVSQVTVEEGQTVKKGQLLIKISHPPFKAKLAQAKAQAALEKARWEDAKIELDQALDLYDRTVTAKRTLDAAQLAHDVAQKTYQKAQAQVDYLQAWQAYYQIKAPQDATVAQIHTPLGATVFKEHTPMIELSR